MYAQNGYEKFKSTIDNNKKEKLLKLKEGQAPTTLFITCSDSRICPNDLTQTDYGELFVIRNAGNTIPHEGRSQGNADAATLEYAVQVLKVEEIVVCGHSHCGAVGALLNGVDSSQLKYIAGYLKELEGLKKLSFEKKLSVEETIQENVKAQVENIKSYEFVQSALKSGLKIHGWVYSLETGNVTVV